MSGEVFGDMIRENRQFVTDELVEFEKQPVEIQECREIPVVLEEFI